MFTDQGNMKKWKSPEGLKNSDHLPDLQKRRPDGNN